MSHLGPKEVYLSGWENISRWLDKIFSASTRITENESWKYIFHALKVQDLPVFADHLPLKDLELPLGISGGKGLLKTGKWYLQIWLRSVIFHWCPFIFRFFFISVGSLKSEPTIVKKNLNIKGHLLKFVSSLLYLRKKDAYHMRPNWWRNRRL